jgi:hypothetical protein
VAAELGIQGSLLLVHRVVVFESSAASAGSKTVSSESIPGWRSRQRFGIFVPGVEILLKSIF